MMYSNIQKTVMRRVWRMYIISIMRNPATMVGVLTVMSGALFARLVFVEQVVHNALATEVGQLPSFVASALLQADAPSLAAFAMLCFSALFFARSVHRARQVVWGMPTWQQ
jgi:hypothetical protein